MKKKVVITGGSGFFGSYLSKKLIESGYSVVSADITPPSVDAVSFVEVDLLNEVPEHEALSDPYAVINLAGKNIFGRWTDDFKALVYETRIEGTENFIELFENEAFRPDVFVSASAVGYYGDAGDTELGADSPAGDGFLARVSKDWEKAAKKAQQYGVNTKIIRNGHILGNGGLLSVLLPYYRWGVGGPLGDGKQWFPWIHIEDVARLYIAAMEADTDAPAIYNAVAPQQIRNREFSRTLADILDRPHVLRIPPFALKLLYGQFGEEMLYSQRVRADHIALLDVSYQYPHVRSALAAVVDTRR